MEIFGISNWLWPTVSVVLAILLVWTLLRRRRAILRSRLPQLIEMEDALKEIYNIQQGEASVEAGALAEALGISVETAKGLMGVLVASGWAEGDVSVGIRLTMQGRERAQELIRAHRLWERYLVDREGMPLEVIHAEANIREHEMTPDEVAKLDADLGHPAWDPHGDIHPDAR